MKSILFATIVLLLFTATSFGQKVKVDVDKTVNFSNFKTFAWEKGQVARNPFVAEMIVAAVESELTSRGLTKTTDIPDIKVGVMAATGANLQAIGPTWNNVNYQVWGGYTNPAAIVTVTTGTLLIDLIETKNNNSVFRGVARETLNNSATADPAADAKKVEKLIKKAVSKMFKQYPGSK